MSASKVVGYVRMSDLYLSNANKLATQRDWSKSGEMLWGSVAVLLKAVGVLHGRPISTHRELVLLGRVLAQQSGDPVLADALRVAERMHANFYENFLAPEDFPGEYVRILDACQKLRGILGRHLGGALPGEGEPAS